MINIKLNKKEYKIPTYKELTVRQLIELKDRKDVNIINYLSVVTGLKFADVSVLKVKNPYNLAIRIGNYIDYTKKTPAKILNIAGRKIYGKNLAVETLGQRFMIEENAKKLKDEEYICYILAVAILGTEMDFSKINSLKEKIMDEPYINVLPTGFFLQKSLWIGKFFEMINLPKRMDLTNTQRKKSRLVLMSLQASLIYTRFKRWLNF